MQIQTASGAEALRRYDVRFTPTFVVFDRSGSVSARTTAVDEAARSLRSLLATP